MEEQKTPQDRGKKRFAPVEYISSNNPGQTFSANPSYSIKKAEITPKSNTLTLEGKQDLFPGYNLLDQYRNATNSFTTHKNLCRGD